MCLAAKLPATADCGGLPNTTLVTNIIENKYTNLKIIFKIFKDLKFQDFWEDLSRKVLKVGVEFQNWAKAFSKCVLEYANEKFAPGVAIFPHRHTLQTLVIHTIFPIPHTEYFCNINSIVNLDCNKKCAKTVKTWLHKT